MEGLYNVRELYPIPEESSQVDVVEMEMVEQPEEHKEGWMKGWAEGLHKILSTSSKNLRSLASSLFDLRRKLWSSWCRRFKWLWQWLEYLVEVFSDLFYSTINLITVFYYGEKSHLWLTGPVLIFCVVKLVTRFKRTLQQAQADNNPANQQNP
ncbi:hypothetical protein I314_02699 [Cryptococcus bacillisporus CA1873]|uniref:Peroxin domain-containing protein n=1 Tax=Cryptococcus bacillisporus CA1873 TaxID=1296111 RepID=A0ABR5BD50_CRYGA|nr:hypothetical protein I314_02699 [Cryptococcus bacillisporus CA1873]|eukprot:KIR63918.1 hypothetical protein I314_02699 [Cryptococcus gattii CA1873]